MSFRLWVAGHLDNIGWWLIDAATAIREVAKATAHARSHPTDLQDR